MNKKIDLDIDFGKVSQTIGDLDYEDRIRYAYDFSDGKLAVGVSGGVESLMLIDSVLHINDHLEVGQRPIKLVCVDIEGAEYDQQRDYIRQLIDQDIPIDIVAAQKPEDKKTALYAYLDKNHISTIAYGKRHEQSIERVNMPFVEHDQSSEHAVTVMYPCLDLKEEDVHQHIDFLNKSLHHPLYKIAQTRDGRANDDVFNAPVCAIKVDHG